MVVVKKDKGLALKASLASVRDAAPTSARILDAAEIEFAQHGLHEARTETIASNCGVTRAMIHYYFATKERLYEAVLERVFEERVHGMDLPSIRTMAPLAALEAFCTRLLEQMCRKPHLAPLFTLENIQNGGRYYGRSGGELYRVLVDILVRGIADGTFRRVNHRHAAINIMGLCNHYFNVSANVRILWPNASRRRKTLARDHARWAIDFVLAVVRPHASIQAKPVVQETAAFADERRCEGAFPR